MYASNTWCNVYCNTGVKIKTNKQTNKQKKELQLTKTMKFMKCPTAGILNQEDLIYISFGRIDHFRYIKILTWFRGLGNKLKQKKSHRG